MGHLDGCGHKKRREIRRQDCGWFYIQRFLCRGNSSLEGIRKKVEKRFDFYNSLPALATSFSRELQIIGL